MRIFFALLITSILCFSPSSSAAQPLQALRGQVIDEISMQPIPNATVAIFFDVSKLETITDSKGMFRFVDIPLGRHKLLISSIGYRQKWVANVVVTAGKEAIVNISLVEEVKELEKVTVAHNSKLDKKSVNNEFLVNSGRSFNMEDTRMFAGSLGDPSRMAANFAGVTGANDSRNDIIIRGNSPTGLLWQLEGIAIPNPNHFGTINTSGGPISMINNNAIDKSDFLTGAFPAQYGNALSGVFDLQMRNGNNENHEILVQAGFNGLELGAEGPLHSGLENSSYLFNYRYSTLEPFVKLGIDVGTGGMAPVYQDVNFKFHIPTRKKIKINVFGIGGIARANFPGAQVDTTLTNFYSNENENARVNTKMGITGVSIENSFSKRTYAKLVLAANATWQRAEIDSVDAVRKESFPSVRSLFTTRKYSAHGFLKHKFSKKDNLVTGVMADITRLQLNRKRIYKGVFERALFQDTASNVLLQLYTQWKHRFNDKFSMVLGLHGQYFDITGQKVIEPRAGVSYTLHANHSVALSYGLHSSIQSPYLYYLRTPVSVDSVVFTNRNLGFTRSHHIVASYDYNISKQWRLRAECYYQHLFDVPVEQQPTSYSALNTGTGFVPIEKDSLVNTGSGNNYGVELTLEKFFGEGYYLLLTTSLFNSRYKGSDGINRNTAFNNKYAANLLAGKEITWRKRNIVGFNIRLTSTGGRWLTPIDEESSQITGEAVFLEGAAFTLRQRPYFRADCRLSYRREFKRSTLELAIDLQNISDNKNVFTEFYNRRKNAVVTQYQQGFLPVPSLRWTFL